MRELPLITHDRPEAVLAWHRGEPISAAQFLGHASALAAALPDTSIVMTKDELVDFERQFQEKLSSAAPIFWLGAISPR